jgi:nitroreductase
VTATLSNPSDLFEVLKKRRACRSFAPIEIPNEILGKLAYAAHRAPTGGNIPYRFIIVVKDPVQLRMLKAAAPGYFGQSTAAIVVCTDLRVDNGITKVDSEQCSLYDAGAAAENIVLAAYALGLGASFIKSYSETALRTILRLPEGCRTELVISLGYPSPSEPAPIRKRREGTITYYDTYGTTAKNPSQSNSNLNSPEQFLFEYALFLLTAAHGIISEPRIYGAIRLVSAVSKLTDLYSTRANVKPDPFLNGAKKRIDAKLDTAMISDEEFTTFIDGLVDEFTHELIRRYGRTKITGISESELPEPPPAPNDDQDRD